MQSIPLHSLLSPITLASILISEQVKTILRFDFDNRPTNDKL